MIKRNKSSKVTEVTATVQSGIIDEETKLQIEKELKAANPSWSHGTLRLNVSSDETVDLLGQVTSLFPNQDIQLETTHGSFYVSGSGSNMTRGQQGQFTDPAGYDPMSRRESSD